jgi:hypothetical protein
MDETAVAMAGVLTGLVSAVMSLGIVFWWIYWSYRKKQLQYHERQLMIEKGLTPPPVLQEQRLTPEGALRRGLVLLFLGAGFGVGAILLLRPGTEAPPPWLLGIPAAIVGCLGLGYLAYYLIARRGMRDARERTDVVL